MESIVLDATNVNNIVIPSLNKANQTLDESYKMSKNILKTIPSSSSANRIKEISRKIDYAKKNINQIAIRLSEKVEKAQAIEKKNKSKSSSLASSVAKSAVAGLAVGATGAIGAATVAGAVKNAQKIEDTKKQKTTIWQALKNTAAKIAGKVVSGVKKIGTTISNAVSKTKDFISNGFKSIISKTTSTAEKIKSWVSKNFNAAKEWTSKALKDTGAFIAKIGKSIGNGLKTAWKWATDIENWKKVGASIANAVIGLVKGVVSLVESILDFALLLGSAASTVNTGILDIAKGIVTGNWDWTVTKKLWNGTRSVVSYEWTNKLAKSFYNTSAGKTLDKYAYKPFKSDGMACQVTEGIGYIAGIIVLTIVTCGIGAAASGGAAAGATATSVSSSAIATLSVGSASATISTGSVVSAGIAAAAGAGKNTSAAWNDGASTVNGLLYGVAKGTYEGFEMGLGYTIGSLKIVQGTGLAAQSINTASHVALDTLDGASGAFVDPLLSMIYSPNAKNTEEIMKLINYDANGNKISNKTWDDLSFSEKYNVLFKYKGGWNTVATQALMAGGMSFLSEIPDLKAAAKISQGTSVMQVADDVAGAVAIGATSKKGFSSLMEKLKGISETRSNNSLKKIITKAQKAGNLEQVAKTLSVEQLSSSLKILDDVSVKSLFNSIDDSQIDDLLTHSDIFTTDFGRQLLSDQNIGARVAKIERFNEFANEISTVSKINLSQIFDSTVGEKLFTIEEEQLTYLLKKLNDDPQSLTIINQYVMSKSRLATSMKNLVDTPYASAVLNSADYYTLKEVFILVANDETSTKKFLNALDIEHTSMLINNSPFTSHIIERLDTETIRKLLLENRIKYTDKLPENIQTIILQNITKQHDGFFSANRFGNDHYGVDQNCSRKYVSYTIKQNCIDNIDDFADYLRNVKGFSEASAENWARWAQNITDGEWLTLDIYEIMSDYLTERSTGSISDTLALLRDNFMRHESPEYVRLKNKLVSQGMNIADATKTLDAINTTGVCSYADIANVIIDRYKNVPDLFERDFGFPLYIELGGNKMFNTDELLVDMYTRINSNEFGGSLFKIEDGKLFINDLNTENQIYLSHSDGADRYVISKYLYQKNPNLMPLFTVDDFIHNYSTLSPLDIKSKIANAMQDGKEISLVVCQTENAAFRFIDENNSVYQTTNSWGEGGAHAVYVTGLNNNGVIVSSWGQKLLIPFEDFNNNRYTITYTSIGGLE